MRHHEICQTLFGDVLVTIKQDIMTVFVNVSADGLVSETYFQAFIEAWVFTQSDEPSAILTTDAMSGI